MLSTSQHKWIIDATSQQSEQQLHNSVPLMLPSRSHCNNLVLTVMHFPKWQWYSSHSSNGSSVTRTSCYVQFMVSTSGSPINLWYNWQRHNSNQFPSFCNYIGAQQQTNASSISGCECILASHISKDSWLCQCCQWPTPWVHSIDPSHTKASKNWVYHHNLIQGLSDLGISPVNTWPGRQCASSMNSESSL